MKEKRSKITTYDMVAIAIMEAFAGVGRQGQHQAGKWYLHLGRYFAGRVARCAGCRHWLHHV